MQINPDDELVSAVWGFPHRRPTRSDTGVEAYRGQRAQVGCHITEMSYRRSVLKVDPDTVHGGTRLRQLGARLLHRRLVDVADHDVRALRGIGPGERQAYSARATGDDRDTGGLPHRRRRHR